MITKGLIMKKILTLLVCIGSSIPCLAQLDIKSLDRIGKEEIIKIIGVPEPEEQDPGKMDGYIYVDYTYSDVLPGTWIVLDENTYELTGFNTNSSNFCVLSDYVPGGFKVGDSFTKLQDFDFVHSPYGKDRPQNALKLIDKTTEREYYKAYAAERKQFLFRVKNGKIIGVDMLTLDEDAAFFYNCDMSNNPW